MPRKKKISSKKPVAKTTQTKAEFVLAQDPKLSAPEIVVLAKAAGFDLTGHRVHNIRWRAKQQTGKKAKIVRAAVKTKSAKVARIGARPGRRTAPRIASSTPRASTGAIAGIHALDLAYAIGRLVAEGRTTAAEVASLAAERTNRIESLEAHLAALKGGEVPAAEVAMVAMVVKATKPRKPMAKRVARPTTKKTGTVTTRVDGRTFTITTKVVAARKWQGQYMGHLRQVPDAEKAKFKAIAKEKGVAVAVVELKKRLGKG
jgi:hypothetical protein